MLKKSLYILLVVVIVVGAVISYKQVDFGGKTTIFFQDCFRRSRPDDEGAREVSSRSG